jgi:PAS domain S-box-containing protein
MSSRLRILFLENDVLDAEIVQDTLDKEGIGCEATRVETAPDFLACLQQGDFDLILADYTLPSFDGQSALRIAREQRPELPFIFVSGTLGEDVAIESLKLGATDYIFKTRLSRLVPSVKRALREAMERAELRRSENALRESEERLRLAVHASSVGLWDWDLQKNQIAFSCEWKSQLGYQEHEIGNEVSEWESRIHPDDLAPTMAALNACLNSTNQEYEAEFRLRHKNASYRWIYARGEVLRDASGKPVRMLGCHVEITKRKQAEEAQRRAEAYLAESQRLTQTGGWATYGTTRDVIYCSENLVRICGFDPQQGTPTLEQIWQRIHPDDRDRFKELSDRTYREKVDYEAEIRFVLPDGTVRHIHAIGHPVLNAKGEIAEIIGTVVDVTERKRAEEEQLKLRQQLHQAQKMEAIGQLAGGVAHDFNNILAIINGYSQMLLRECDLKEAQKSSVEEILAAGQRAAALTRQLLAFSRKLVLQPKVISLNSVVEGFDKMLRRLIGDEIEVRTVLEPNLDAVNADPNQMEQVLLNFCINARDAMPEGGRITIQTANVEMDEATAAQHVVLAPGRYVRLSVSDTGIGMDKETLARLFEPFFTTKGPEHGTGLGLATVYGIAKQSGGSVSAYSEPGQGATFSVYLPIATQQALSRELEPMPREFTRGSETILLVEDAAPLRALYRKLIEDHGYTVLEAEDGERALQIAERFQGSIALLLTDVSLPKMKGAALAKILVQQRPAIKVLFMSGYADDVVAGPDQILQPGTNFLHKPFGAEALVTKMRELLDMEEDSRAQPGFVA